MRPCSLVWLALLGCAPDPVPPTSDPTVETLPAIATCALGPACEVGAGDQEVRASYRKDVFYPYGPGALAGPDAFGTTEAPAYPEAGLADPVDGGRVHLIARAAVSGSLVPAEAHPVEGLGERGRAAWSITLDGLSLDEALAAGRIDWVRVVPETFAAGDPIWISLHSEDPGLDTRGTLRVELPTAEGGLAVDAEISLTPTLLPLASVVHDDALSTVWVHVRNEDDRPHRLDRVYLSGLDVTEQACLALRDVAPGETLTLQVPRCEPAQPGEIWTVTLTWEDAPSSVAGGRVLPAHYPIHTWPSASDCPLPGVNDANFQAHAEAGYDTFFVRSRYDGEGCNDVPTEQAIAASFDAAGAWAMLDEWTPMPVDTSRVAARLLGDEVDNRSPEDLRANQRFQQLAEETAWMNAQTPEVPTYVGGSRHRTTATTAGVADIQGMDFYAAACAPHITDFGRHPPLRGPYDYLRVTVRNHEPGTTWLYAQGQGGWSGATTPTDVRLAALSVAAAGAQGLMWFVTSLERAAEHPDTWAAMGEVNLDLRAVRDQLRLGTPSGLASSDADALVEAIRVPRGLVLVVAGLASTAGPEELPCALGSYTPWVLAEQEVAVDVRIPDDLAVYEVFEVVDGAAVALTGTAVLTEDRHALLEVPVGPQAPGRLVVLAADPTWRQELTR